MQLKSSDTQIPDILRKFLLWVERQHYRCRLIVVDTYAGNISQEAADTCAEFDCVIRPISAGTPQELGRAEKAVGELRRMTRCSLASAPHLNPKLLWGLADSYNTWIHYVLPGPNGAPSPYEICERRKPGLRNLFVKVWGCPVSYKPMTRTPGYSSNKNMPISTSGYFVGLQWPMVLILRKSDNKVISVSRKKLRCYESMYVVPAFLSPMFKGLISMTDTEESLMSKFIQSTRQLHPPKPGSGNEGEWALPRQAEYVEVDIATSQANEENKRESARLKAAKSTTPGDQLRQQLAKQPTSCSKEPGAAASQAGDSTG